MLGDKRFLQKIKINNLLSFGPESPELELESLNVLIGPNGSGKSNLIDVISLLQAAPGNLFAPTRVSGFGQWMWKGPGAWETAQLEVAVGFPEESLSHRLAFAMVDQAPHLAHEEVLRSGGRGTKMERPVPRAADGYRLPNLSILSQLKEPRLHPEITFLGREYSSIRLFREWELGRGSPPRLPQGADLPADFLLEDAANLPLVLNA